MWIGAPSPSPPFYKKPPAASKNQMMAKVISVGEQYLTLHALGTTVMDLCQAKTPEAVTTDGLLSAPLFSMTYVMNVTTAINNNWPSH